jgi:hypothetical protein
MDLRPTTEADAAAVSAFLGRMFAPSSSSPPSSLPAAAAGTSMRWKYWAQRADWSGPRSFTVRQGGAIVAHAAAWPVRLRVPGGIVPSVHVIDWAADPAYPGAGLWLMRQLTGKVPLAIATGGSAMTRRILPLIGFHHHGEIGWFAKPVRPLGQARTTPDPDWKLPARVLRNALWRFSTPLSPPRGWTAEPIGPEEIPERLWPQPSETTAVTVRDPDFYRYVIGAPSARHALFGLTRQGELAGYFCVAFGRHVARIADLWLATGAHEDWGAACRTAAALAAAPDDVYEVTAWASTPLGAAAWRQAGFRLRDRTAVSIRGDRSLLDGRALHVQMLDCDASFLTGETIDYLT